MTVGNRKSQVLTSSSQRAVRVDRGRLARLLRFVAREEGQRLGQIDLAVVGKDEIASHNHRWLRHAGATDVLSFDLSEGGGGISGQLIVCGEVAAEQARLRGLPAQEELMLYVVHGLLHLCGYDDLAVRAAARMHAREEELLREFLGRSRGGTRTKAQTTERKAGNKRRRTAGSSPSKVMESRVGASLSAARKRRS
jgi:probable rRNA maturation factor